MTDQSHELCKLFLQDLISISKDNSGEYDEDFKDFVRSELEEIREEVDTILIENS